jgi:hypothetical protein
MSKESKTARASMAAGQAKVEKKVLSDADLIKNLRLEVSSGLYPTIQGSHALLREYDKLLEYANGLEKNVWKLQGEADQLKAEIGELRVSIASLEEQLNWFTGRTASLGQFIMETFPNDYVEGEDITETAIQIFKDLLQANEGVSSLARKLASELEERSAPPTAIEHPNES